MLGEKIYQEARAVHLHTNVTAVCTGGWQAPHTDSAGERSSGDGVERSAHSLGRDDSYPCIVSCGNAFV